VTATALKWGVDPLPEQVRLADLLREVTSLVLSQENSGPELGDLIRSMGIARTVLAGSAPLEDEPRVGGRADGDGRVYIDHCADIHAWNPMFPAYSLDAFDAESASGRVNFPICYEGPAGGVNGGVLGVFFDAVVQHHNCALGVSGATRDLNITYHRMTPLLVDLTFEITRTMEERSILSEVRVLHEGKLVSSAVTRAAIFETANPPAISPRR
jgi:hypothetical protein